MHEEISREIEIVVLKVPKPSLWKIINASLILYFQIFGNNIKF